MASEDLLQTFLQTYLASEAQSVTFLPAILSTLSSCDVGNSPNLSKWVNKINSLIHSKDGGVRWSGLCLALKTSQMARSVMLDSAQGWVSVVLPQLSKQDNPVIYKAEIRLLSYMFTTTTELSEFQRQVVTPNVPKFSSALISLVEKFPDLDLKAYCMDVLSVLVQTFGNLNRPLAAQLSTLSLGFLNGSSTAPTPDRILKASCRLHACLHNTGGKVGGAALWRKSIDETIGFCNESLVALLNGSSKSEYRNDPMAFTTLNVDRLKCGIELVCSLLCTPVSRAVLMPVKALVGLCTELFNNSSNELANDVDPSFGMLAEAAQLHFLQMACKLVSVIASCIGKRLGPEQSRLLSIIAFKLERPLPTPQRLQLVHLLPALLGPCLHPADPLVSGRIVKTLLPIIGLLFPQKAPTGSTTVQVRGNKKAKKRLQGYEGDEVFNVERGLLLAPLEAELIIHVLDALPFLLNTPDLPEYIRSLTSRVLLSLVMLLPTVEANSISFDPTLHERILIKVKSITIELTSASGPVLCKTLPIIVGAMGSDSHNARHEKMVVDLLLHPRLPPLLRPIPHLNEIALTSVEEGEEERKIREASGLTDVLAASTVKDSIEAHPNSVSSESKGRNTSEHIPVERIIPVPGSQKTPSSTTHYTPSTSSTSAQPATQVRAEPERGFANQPSQTVEIDILTSKVTEHILPTSRELPEVDDEKRKLEWKRPPTAIQRPDAQEPMVVDDADDEDDIVIPPLSMASDSEEEE